MGEHFVLPEAVIDDNVATLPLGLDGRKMSKSYNSNTIPVLFSSRDQLKKLIGSLLTDSRALANPRTPSSALFQIYQAFATPEETEALRRAYAEGIAGAMPKKVLLERVNQVIAPMREQMNR